jgi:hypothetical protein
MSSRLMPLYIQGVLNTTPPVKISDGNVTHPGIFFSNSRSTGLFASSNTLGITSNATQVATFSPGRVDVHGELSAHFLTGNCIGLYGIPLGNTFGTLGANQLPSTIHGNGFGLYDIPVSNILGLDDRLDDITANSISGNGLGLYGIALANTFGTLAEHQLPANISGNGFGLYAIDASNILGLEDQLQNVTANSLTANFVSGNGVGLYGILASNIEGLENQLQNLSANSVTANYVAGNGSGLYGILASNVVGLENQLQNLSANSVTANFVSGNGSGLYGILTSNVVGLENQLQNLSANSVTANYLGGNGSGLYGILASNVVGLENQLQNLSANSVTANFVNGNGSGLYGILASNIEGLENQLQNLSANSVTANYVAGNGSGLYGILASNVVGLENQLQNLSANSVTANFIAGNGYGIYGIVASNITSGILGIARGGTGASTSTGSGSVVLRTDPVFDASVTVQGNLRVGGNLVVDTGNVVYINTETQLTDQLLITNAGTGPALVARQDGAEPIAEFLDDANVVFKMYDGGALAIAPGTSSSLNNTTTPPTPALLSVLGSVSSNTLIENRVLISNTSKIVESSSVTTTELERLRGVTSNVQTQLDSKQPTITGAATTITGSDLTVSRALVSDASGKVAVSAVTSTELGYVIGATSNIQAQLNGKAASVHTHDAANITSGTLAVARGGTGVTTSTGTGSVVLNTDPTFGANVTVSGLTADRVVISNSSKTLVSSSVTSAELGYVSGVTSGIQTQLNAKAAAAHVHDAANITSGTLAVARGGTGTTTSTGTGSVVLSTDPTFGANVTVSGLTADRVLVSNSSKTLVSSSVTSAELGYVSGVTSGIQTQLNAKEPTITGAATTITGSNLTVSRALVSDASGKVAVSAVTSTELSYVTGATSNIQAQLNGKAASVHTHDAANITSGTLVVARGGTGVTTSTGSGSVVLNTDPTFRGNIILPGYGVPGDNQIQAGNGDDASYSTNNFYIRGWNGIGFRDYTNTCRTFLNTRDGTFSTQGKVVAGSVGINTSSPTQALHVVGNAIVSGTVSGNGSPLTGLNAANIQGELDSELVLLGGGDFLANANATAAAPSYAFDGRTQTGMWSPAANTIAFSTGGVEEMRIDPAGNVGINTTTPTQALHVVGNVVTTGVLNFGSRVQNNLLCLNGNSTNPAATGYYGFGINGDTLRYQVAGTSAVHRFYGGTTQYAAISIGGLDVTGRLTGSVGTAALPSYAFTGRTQTGMWSPAANTIAFSTGGVEKVRLHSDGNVQVSGNVSCGYILGNGSLLEGVSASNASALTEGTLSQQVFPTTIGNSATTYNAQVGLASTPSYAFASDPTTGMYRYASGQLGFSTSGTERMRIQSTGMTVQGGVITTGNIGIATNTSAQYPLDIGTTGATMHESSTNSMKISNNMILFGGQRVVWYYNWSIRALNGGNFQFYYGTFPEIATTSIAYITTGGVFTTGSDVRLKRDIEPLPYGLQEIIQLQPKWYFHENEPQTATKRHPGLVAQDVVKVIPEVVGIMDEDSSTLPMMGLSYTELIPVLINAIKEQQTLIQDLQLRMASLEQS